MNPQSIRRAILTAAILMNGASVFSLLSIDAASGQSPFLEKNAAGVLMARPDRLQMRMQMVTRSVRIYGKIIDGGTLGDQIVNCDQLKISYQQASILNGQTVQRTIATANATGGHIRSTLSGCQYSLEFRQPLTSLSVPETRLFSVKLESAQFGGRFIVKGNTLDPVRGHLPDSQQVDVVAYMYMVNPDPIR
jgi:hypothetical protein